MRRSPGWSLPGLLLLLVLPSLLADAPPIAFEDVTASAGVRFRHTNGAFGKRYLPETMGSGCAFLDYDGDGAQDILLVNSRHWSRVRGAASSPALYRNRRDGTFTNVTREAGLAVETYGLGVAAADYDNDGRTDIYLTALDRNRLYRNAGGSFVDVTAASREAASRRAPSGSTPTRTASWTSSWPATWSGRSRRTSSARSTARASPTARPSRTRARAPAKRGRRGPAWASTPATTTARDGPASSSATSRPR